MDRDPSSNDKFVVHAKIREMMNLTIADEESIPLQPLNDIILKFNRRRKIMDLLMLLSLPAALVGIVLFAAFTLEIGFSSYAVVVFGFLAFSAAASYVAILYIPGTISKVIRSMEATAQNISFTITQPKGENPEKRILNQLLRTDYYVKRVIEKEPNSAQVNARVLGRSGKVHSFDVYIHSANLLGRLFATNADMNVFATRFDDIDPIDVALVREVKEAVQDSLSKAGRRVPTRVLVISTSGFDESVFEYVRNREGSFDSRFSRVNCHIELIKEKVDGSFDVLSF